MVGRGDPRKALEALASEHGLPILRFLRGRGWILASQVAEGLGVHTSTASKHLASFFEAGIVERRSHTAKRPTFAYRLLTPVVRIELDLAEPAEPADVGDAAEGFAQALLAAAARMGGMPLAADLARTVFGGDDWRDALRATLAASRDPRAFLEGLVHAAGEHCAARLGTVAGRRLVQIALDAAAEGREDLFPAQEATG